MRLDILRGFNKSTLRLLGYFVREFVSFRLSNDANAPILMDTHHGRFLLTFRESMMLRNAISAYTGPRNEHFHRKFNNLATVHFYASVDFQTIQDTRKHWSTWT